MKIIRAMGANREPEAEAQVRDGEGAVIDPHEDGGFVPSNLPAMPNLPPMEEMLRPFFNTQGYKFLQGHAAQYEAAAKWVKRRINFRNFMFMLFALLMLSGDAIMNVLGVIAESDYNRRRKVQAVIAPEAERLEAESAVNLTKEQAALQTLEAEQQTLKHEVAKAKTHAEAQGAILSITRTRLYGARADTLEAKASRARGRITKLQSERDARKHKLEEKAQEAHKNGLDFYGMLVLGGLIPFAVGFIMYRRAILIRHGENDGEVKTLLWVGVLGQVLAASFAMDFCNAHFDRMALQLGEVKITLTGVLVFALVIFLYSKVYDQVCKTIVEAQRDKLFATYRARKELLKDLEARLEQASVFARIGKSFVEAEQERVKSELAFRESLAQKKYEYAQAVHAAQELEHKAELTAEVWDMLPGAATAADFGRALAKMEASGELEKIYARGIKLIDICKRKGFEEQYSTVTSIMTRARKEREAATANGQEEAS